MVMTKVSKFNPRCITLSNRFREVLANPDLLDMEERADWKNCTASKEEETKAALDFRNIFKPFDFTL
jgi:hypothetical protein